MAIHKFMTRMAFLTLFALPIFTAKASVITVYASGAKNVSDYQFDPVTLTVTLDGLGDQVATDPYPLLGAGIFLSGASGQNGTARFQMEFSLAGIMAPIKSAFLVLNTDDSPISSKTTLDTTFFHVTGDEEGVITSDDFESAAVTTGIVQSVAQGPAQYSYDVTSFVKSDLGAGFAFTSYQGRVDELAFDEFQRGLEFLSNAPTSGLLSPRLVIETAVPEPSSWALLLSGIAFIAGRRYLVRK